MKITIAKLLGTTKFPLYLYDKDVNITYYEDSNGRWIPYEFDSCWVHKN